MKMMNKVPRRKRTRSLDTCMLMERSTNNRCGIVDKSRDMSNELDPDKKLLVILQKAWHYANSCISSGRALEPMSTVIRKTPSPPVIHISFTGLHHLLPEPPSEG